jgi:trafficking protein particle complex subunit 9
VHHEERGAEFRELINECKSGRKDREGWKDRIRGIRCDGRTMAGCGAAIAEALEIFERIDILLCCKSEGMLWPLPISFSPALRGRVSEDMRGC